jgi:hypothetical protein
MWYDIVKRASALQWDPETRKTSKVGLPPSETPPEEDPSEAEGGEPQQEAPAPPSPIDVETARLQKLLQHSQTRLQLLQTQMQLAESGAAPDGPTKEKPANDAKK